MNELAVIPAEEKKLGSEVSRIEQDASALTVRTDADFQKAAAAVKMVKTALKKVEDYWEPMRKNTYAAYKSVTDHKKSMTDPLKKAETILKRKMSDYQVAQEQKRIEQEMALRALATAEMEKKLAEASEAEKAGDEFAADYAMAEAEILEATAQSVHISKNTAKADGISQVRSWTITDIDLTKLPDNFAGILIRPADEKAIMRLIKESGGNVHIPGVSYQETVNFRVKVS